MILHSFIFRLQQNKRLNFLLIIAYGAIIIWGHDLFVNLSIAVMNGLSLPVYNLVVKCIATSIFLVLSAVLIYNLYKTREALYHKLFYLAATALLLIIHFSIMLEMNIEIIHAIEYSVLCVLIYPVAKSYGGAIVFSLPFMLTDELNQYVHLYPQYTKYFEFNDIILDILGAAMSMIFIYISTPAYNHPRPVLKRSELYVLISLSGLFTILLGSCIIARYATTSCSNTVFILSKLPNPGSFWQVHDFTKAIYHVCTPVEGFAIMIALCAFYLGMDIKKAQH
jgi:hypothetical protein